MGITALLAAIAQPEALKAAYVIVAPESMWNEATWINGVFKEADMTGWMKSQGVADQIEGRRASLLNTAEEAARDIIRAPPQDRDIRSITSAAGTTSSPSGRKAISLSSKRRRRGARSAETADGSLRTWSLAGDIKYKGGGGPLAALAEEQRWFDHHLKGKQNGIDENRR